MLLSVGQQTVRRFCLTTTLAAKVSYLKLIRNVTTEKRMSGRVIYFQVSMKQLRFLLVLWAVFGKSPPKDLGGAKLLLNVCEQLELLACLVA